MATSKSKQTTTKSKKAPKPASKAPKASSKAPKPASKAPKAASGGLKAASEGLKAASEAAERDLKVPESSPELPAVALVAPPRRGRTVLNQEEALKNAEIRLKLAWLHRTLLDQALPQQPPFHAHAWTALRLLQEHEGAALEESEKTQATLDALLVELVKIRKIVAATTPRGDARREKVGMGRALRATRALVDDGETILRGAEQVQKSFPALVPAVLARAKAALEKAHAAVERSKSREVDESVRRANHADEQQLALDVLLDSVDHLRAAALAVLTEQKPRLAELLEGPLEVRSRNDEDEPEPTPEPAPEPGKDK